MAVRWAEAGIAMGGACGAGETYVRVGTEGERKGCSGLMH